MSNCCSWNSVEKQLFNFSTDNCVTLKDPWNRAHNVLEAQLEILRNRRSSTESVKTVTGKFSSLKDILAATIQIMEMVKESGKISGSLTPKDIMEVINKYKSDNNETRLSTFNGQFDQDKKEIQEKIGNIINMSSDDFLDSSTLREELEKLNDSIENLQSPLDPESLLGNQGEFELINDVSKIVQHLENLQNSGVISTESGGAPGFGDNVIDAREKFVLDVHEAGGSLPSISKRTVNKDIQPKEKHQYTASYTKQEQYEEPKRELSLSNGLELSGKGSWRCMQKLARTYSDKVERLQESYDQNEEEEAVKGVEFQSEKRTNIDFKSKKELGYTKRDIDEFKEENQKMQNEEYNIGQPICTSTPGHTPEKKGGPPPTGSKDMKGGENITSSENWTLQEQQYERREVPRSYHHETYIKSSGPKYDQNVAQYHKPVFPSKQEAVIPGGASTVYNVVINSGNLSSATSPYKTQGRTKRAVKNKKVNSPPTAQMLVTKICKYDATTSTTQLEKEMTDVNLPEETESLHHQREEQQEIRTTASFLYNVDSVPGAKLISKSLPSLTLATGNHPIERSLEINDRKVKDGCKRRPSNLTLLETSIQQEDTDHMLTTVMSVLLFLLFLVFIFLFIALAERNLKIYLRNLYTSECYLAQSQYLDMFWKNGFDLRHYGKPPE